MPNTRKNKTHNKGPSPSTVSPAKAADTTASFSSIRHRLQKAPAGPKTRKDDNGSDLSNSEGESEQETADQREDSAMPNVPSDVVRKLVSFSLLLLVAPILSYFVSLKYIFVGATASSAIVAVIAANLVLAAFVYSAWNEELDPKPDQPQK
ncbi:hypothetical protein LPJ64_004057 [Coemansia asiatica]|uniref:Vacuolar ATPase assembly integral membrane protein VMA21 n=1 Tax=Coemansia asiatica TaxID=1052880 RepID=A0A9W7XJW5_9FUNG|nr:hypothetical protein LPJ64_004057 [Coemansia asiatica]